MIDWLKDIATWWTTGLLGMLLYWLPAAFCVAGYTMKSWGDYRRDIKARDADTYYHPSITVGTLIGRAVLSAVPVANLIAGIFDVAPHVFGNFLDWLGRVFSVPLVKARPKAK